MPNLLAERTNGYEKGNEGRVPLKYEALFLFSLSVFVGLALLFGTNQGESQGDSFQDQHISAQHVEWVGNQWFSYRLQPYVGRMTLDHQDVLLSLTPQAPLCVSKGFKWSLLRPGGLMSGKIRLRGIHLTWDTIFDGHFSSFNDTWSVLLKGCQKLGLHEDGGGYKIHLDRIKWQINAKVMFV